jgi:rare lipoprotein A
MTAAHRSLPFGTKVKVTNQRNGKAVVVRINDRGPFIKGRVIDLSKAAARTLGFVGAGHTKICMSKVG